MTQTWRIVTYNTWKCDGLYRDRLTWMGQGLKALAPDILCLQEAFSCPERGADTAQHFSEFLDMNVEILSARRKRRCFEGEQLTSFSNLAILSRHAMSRGEDVALAEHEKDSDRWAMQVAVSASETCRLRVVNTHLTHIRGRTGDLVRKAQAGALADLCVAQGGEIVLLCGDFNDVWESESLSPLRKMDWCTAQKEIDGGTFLGPHANADVIPRRIDEIQVSTGSRSAVNLAKRFPALNSPVGPHREYASDHAALVVDLQIETIKQEQT